MKTERLRCIQVLGYVYSNDPDRSWVPCGKTWYCAAAPSPFDERSAYAKFDTFSSDSSSPVPDDTNLATEILAHDHRWSADLAVIIEDAPDPVCRGHRRRHRAGTQCVA